MFNIVYTCTNYCTIDLYSSHFKSYIGPTNVGPTNVGPDYYERKKKTANALILCTCRPCFDQQTRRLIDRLVLLYFLSAYSCIECIMIIKVSSSSCDVLALYVVHVL